MHTNQVAEWTPLSATLLMHQIELKFQVSSDALFVAQLSECDTSTPPPLLAKPFLTVKQANELYSKARLLVPWLMFSPLIC